MKTMNEEISQWSKTSRSQERRNGPERAKPQNRQGDIPSSEERRNADRAGPGSGKAQSAAEVSGGSSAFLTSS